MDIMVVIDQMVMLFVILIIGYSVAKLKFANEDLRHKFSGFILNVTLPFLMISSVSQADSSGSGRRVVLTFIIAILLFALMPFVGKLLARVLRAPASQRDIYEFMTVFSNLSFMGFPVIHAIFGPDAMAYAIIFSLVFNLVQFTYGVTLFRGEKAKLRLRMFLTPTILGSILAILMFLGGIKIQGPLGEAFLSVGSITTPLAMLVIGMTLSAIPLREVFSDPRLYLFTFIKQLLIPAAAFFALRLVIQDELILGITVIVIAMPVATMAVILANQYDRHVGIATRAVFLTTLASVLTIPLIAALMVR